MKGWRWYDTYLRCTGRTIMADRLLTAFGVRKVSKPKEECNWMPDCPNCHSLRWERLWGDLWKCTICGYRYRKEAKQANMDVKATGGTDQ